MGQIWPAGRKLPTPALNNIPYISALDFDAKEGANDVDIVCAVKLLGLLVQLLHSTTMQKETTKYKVASQVIYFNCKW